LPELQFIREGEFSETKGAPTLRLIGEVRPAAQAQDANASVVRRNVTDDAVLKNFLRQTSVAYPLDYLQRSCHTQRHWLPMFYYMKMAGISVEQTIALFDAEEPPYPKICKAAADRLRGTVSAFRKPVGAATKSLSAINSGSLHDPSDPKEAATIAHAVGGLTVVGPELFGCLALLEKCLGFSKGPRGGSLRSQIYRAACRPPLRALPHAGRTLSGARPGPAASPTPVPAIWWRGWSPVRRSLRRRVADRLQKRGSRGASLASNSD